MRSLIIANWKMNPQSLKGAKLLLNSVKRGIRNVKKVEVVICPPFPYLSSFKFPRSTPSSRRKGPGGRQVSSFKIGAQNCFWEKKGAFSGEISPSMLKNLGCKYVIIGHSERRRYLAETDEMINKKIRAALRAKLSPIFCIGENREQRDRGKTFDFLKSQILKGLEKIPKKEIKNIIFAYEPIWAVGTGKPCDFTETQIMGLFIRKTIGKLYTSRLSHKIRILYGGSVNSQNASDYIKEAKMDGLLIGAASLDAKEFVKLIKNLTLK